MADEVTPRGDLVIASLFEQGDALDSVAAAFCSITAALLRAGVTTDELRRLLDMAAEATS